MDEETSRNGEIAGTADPLAAWPEGWVFIGYTEEGTVTFAEGDEAIDLAAFNGATMRIADIELGPGRFYWKPAD